MSEHAETPISATSVLNDDLRDEIAQDIWSYTGSEEGCRRCGPYEPCVDCLRVIYEPAADAVLATLRRSLALQQNGGPVAGNEQLEAALQRLRWVVPGRSYDDLLIGDVETVLRHFGMTNAHTSTSGRTGDTP